MVPWELPLSGLPLIAVYILISIQFMHRRLMPEEKWRWYIQDVGMPVGLTLLVAMFWAFFLPQGISSFWLTIIFSYGLVELRYCCHFRSSTIIFHNT